MRGEVWPRLVSMAQVEEALPPLDRPIVIVPGAQKAGTSSLFHALVRHDQIGRPSVKEPQFFALRRRTVNRYLDWYRGEFEANAAVLLDASTFYLHSRRAPKNVAACCSDPYVVVLVRDPVQRAHSGYLHMRKKVPPRERRSFRDVVGSVAERCGTSGLKDAEEEALKAAASSGNIDSDYLNADYLRGRFGAPFDSHFEDLLFPYRYFGQSLYMKSIERWREAVGEGRVKVVVFEDMIRNPAEVITGVLEFVGIDVHAEVLDLPHTNATRLPSGRMAELLVVSRRRILNSERAESLRSTPLLGGVYAGLVKLYARLRDRLYVRPSDPDEDCLVKCDALLSAEYERWSTQFPKQIRGRWRNSP